MHLIETAGGRKCCIFSICATLRSHRRQKLTFCFYFDATKQLRQQKHADGQLVPAICPPLNTMFQVTKKLIQSRYCLSKLFWQTLCSELLWLLSHLIHIIIKHAKRNLLNNISTLCTLRVNSVRGHLVFSSTQCVLRYSEVRLINIIGKDCVLTLFILIKLLLYKVHMESEITGRTHKGVCYSLVDTA